MARQETQTGAPIADDRLGGIINQLGRIAAQSADSLLTEGPVHPDHALLGLAADALHVLKQARKADTDAASILDRAGAMTEADRVEFWRAREHERALRTEAAAMLRRIAKLRATTAAGIYAKALLVRMAPSGSPKLAVTLAAELVECRALMGSLWPAEGLE